MGKGDIKTKRGKIHRGTTGVRRKAKPSNSIKPKELVDNANKVTGKEVKTPENVVEKIKKTTKKLETPELFSEEKAID